MAVPVRICGMKAGLCLNQNCSENAVWSSAVRVFNMGSKIAVLEANRLNF